MQNIAEKIDEAVVLGLSDPTLLRTKAFIAGAWADADDGRVVEVFDPATGRVLGTVPAMGSGETRRAVEAAERARPAFAGLTAGERSGLLRRWFDLIVAHTDDLARILTAEQGKPLSEAKGELRYGASFVEWFAEEAKRVYGDVIPAPKPNARVIVLKQPVGVAAAITPWNFPIAMITRKVAPALAAGCPVVVKPSELTPFSALALAELAVRAGFPDGVLSIVTGEPQGIGGELTANPLVRKLSFTGSTRVGKLLMAQCAGTVKKVSMELGGNAPLLVFDDADLETAVRGAMSAKFRNTGQACIAANRIYVQSGIYEEFAMALGEAMERLEVANGFQDGASQGPLINEAAVVKVERQLADAVKRGATIRNGGGRHPLGGTFFEPTLVTDVHGDMEIAKEETFGPVAALFRFETESEVLAHANRTEHGLAAYVFTRDVDRMWRIVEGLETGMVGVNDGLISNEMAPFGGIKESGLGREGSKYGIEEYLVLKYVLVTAKS